MRITIEATLIRATEDMLVQAGDSLIIYNGVCIGCQAAEDFSLPEKTNPAEWSAEDFSSQILQALVSFERPVTVFALRKKLGVPNSDKASCAETSLALQRLWAEGKIIGIKAPGASKKSLWALAKESGV